MSRPYLPRLADERLARALASHGAVLIEGPKACGKTMTAQQVAASQVRLDLDVVHRRAGAADPRLLLDGGTPRLIDEWQLVPEVWNAVRAEVDERGEDGQFVLTGSAMPADEATRHTGAMRIARVRMWPMSLLESGDSTGAVSLAALLRGEAPRAAGSEVDLPHVADLVVRGGWPSNLSRSVDAAREANHSYLLSISGVDVPLLDGTRIRDPRKVDALLFALARSSASYVTSATLRADVVGQQQSIDPRTLERYLDALARLGIYVEQRAWGEHLRSSAQVRKAPKRHLVCPSLAAAALGASPAALLDDHETFGVLVESLAFRDLSVYADVLGTDVRCYQDNHGREIDAVVVQDDRWVAFEVTLAASAPAVDAAAASLSRTCAAMRRAPVGRAVLVPYGPSYRRPDGVDVVSLLDLGP